MRAANVAAGTAAKASGLRSFNGAFGNSANASGEF